jgi:hypothetical protein
MTRVGMGDAAASVWERFWVIRQAFQLLEPQSAMMLLPINPRLERPGIGQGALGEVRSGAGRAQRPLTDNRGKFSSGSAGRGKFTQREYP